MCWLAVDSGNTRIKWALVRGRRIIQTGASIGGLSAAARRVDEVVISDVGDKKRRAAMIKAVKGCDDICFVPPPPVRDGGVRNHYRKPQTLGIDRWLAILAAAEKRRDVVIADAGTALTIDALTGGGDFIGGMIAPGAALMRRALADKTGLTNGGGKVQITQAAAGCDSASAIASGVGAAMAGAVLAFRRRVLPRAAIIITGGDADVMLPWLPRAVLHKPHLVMEGIIRWRELRL